MIFDTSLGAWIYRYVGIKPWSCDVEKTILSDVMPSRRKLILILCCMALNPCWAQRTADKAANSKTQEILTYMAGLPKQGTDSAECIIALHSSVIYR